jgi:AraC-like DNA-binding protein
MSFRQLNEEICREGAFRSLGLRLTTDYIVTEISRMLHDESRARSLAARHPGVRRALALLDASYQERWRLRDLARATGTSPNYLAEIFAKKIGVPPHRYLLNVRIERAKEILKRDNMSITDLALSLGFASSQHFARAFKLATGRTTTIGRNPTALVDPIIGYLIRNDPPPTWEETFVSGLEEAAIDQQGRPLIVF